MRMRIAVVLCLLARKYNTKLPSCTYVFFSIPQYVHISTDDYTAVSEVLIFNSGSLSRNVTVRALPDTVSGEGDEFFSLSLTEDDDAVILMMSTASVNITDASKLYSIFSKKKCSIYSTNLKRWHHFVEIFSALSNVQEACYLHM